MCVLLLHYLPWCIHWKWPYTSVNMSSHWWWHPKSLTSTPSPTVGHQSTNELLYCFCGDYPLSLTMSANDRAGTILKWFLPLESATRVWEGGQVTGRGESFIIPWLVISSSISLSSSPVVLTDTRNRKGHCTLSHFLFGITTNRTQNILMQMSRIRSQRLTSIPPSASRLQPSTTHVHTYTKHAHTCHAV